MISRNLERRLERLEDRLTPETLKIRTTISFVEGGSVTGTLVLESETPVKRPTSRGTLR